MDRREVIAAATVAGLAAVACADDKDAPVKARDPLKVTKLETFLVQPRWLFLKVHTNAGIVGLGEPIVEGRAETVQTAVKEIEPYLIGKDPRAVAHHWQAIYRHAFYRGTRGQRLCTAPRRNRYRRRDLRRHFPGGDRHAGRETCPARSELRVGRRIRAGIRIDCRKYP